MSHPSTDFTAKCYEGFLTVTSMIDPASLIVRPSMVEREREKEDERCRSTRIRQVSYFCGKPRNESAGKQIEGNKMDVSFTSMVA